MWKDTIEERFFWARMQEGLEKFLFELIKAEEEEDAGIYLLLMHFDHAREEGLAVLPHKEKILQNLALLIGESRRHQKLLQEAIEELEKKGAAP